MLAASDSINVTIDNKEVEFTADSGKPFIDKNNRTLVPFRVILEQFGAEVKWIDFSQGVVIATKNDLNVRIFVGENYVDQYKTETWPRASSEPHHTWPVAIDTNIIIKDNRVYIPIRSVLEAFHAQITWDDKTKTIIISSEKI
ncbi:copper amine oxidase N-terminal domain-containing protein [Schinkia azotoformans]|uniref:Copper amine oxidase domain-containing protein n=1 Tax=Schinkia azotoformans LMG 9581 TaxID=1131731 RepID=K6DL00_SCHAZ|nr:copper amine oxidase N-terminal domain-containing protein [Schinkia azotoformans]EKN68843.1 copper amine oxidase domain-containing protein [Schinkia azotoformans LMG 9581]MEC1638317.1 copper amine oxidase N-terminal domain-containing protein [Schinkia azotoformans]MEC1722860.1 copper amine oxidase N-terminal domain-containing protein [Schinkia azotoformans]MEC1946249.1 copper amine oxidase N-terminal domain-containing protein [Schinkia azotoformans]MED4414288.1 copper amine oxidase N-termin